MIDAAQILLVIVITVLTVLLVAIGLQVVNIHKEFKKSLEKINKILDDAGAISENVAKPVSDIAGFFKMIGLLVDFVKDRRKKPEEKQEKEEEKPKEQEHKPKNSPSPKPSRRFFSQNGKKLA